MCRDGRVEVLAPLKLKTAEIERFVAEKHDWIELHRQAALQNEALRKQFLPDYGDTVLVCGRSVLLQPGKRTELANSVLFIRDGRYIKAEIIKFYRGHLRSIVEEYIDIYAPLMGAKPERISITGAKGSWGSCSGRRVCFSWRLCMARHEAIEYVVVHELAHISEKNHKPGFWDIVGRYIHDINDCKMQLKELQKILKTQNWEETP